jgi:hypothetical protein
MSIPGPHFPARKVDAPGGSHDTLDRDAGDHALRLGSFGPGAVGSAGFSSRLSLSVALVDPANYPEEARRCFNYF